jgi:hypothetical protein
MLRALAGFLVCAGLLVAAGCQSPTSASSTLSVDDFVTAAISPDPATAVDAVGKTYRVVRGNNQPDEILPYSYVTSFAITLTVTSEATSDSVDLTFPVTITSVSGKVQQAAAGIVTPPTGGDVEHYESLIAQSSGSQFAAVNGTITMSFQVWYALPNGRREAVVTESISLKDDSGKTFTKNVDVKVAP